MSLGIDANPAVVPVLHTHVPLASLTALIVRLAISAETV